MNGTLTVVDDVVGIGPTKVVPLVVGGGEPSSVHLSGHGSGGGGAVSLSSKPTLIVSGKLRFLIMDAPRQSNLHLYIRECRRNRVTDVVRVCEPTYNGGELSTAGMRLHEMAYDDGRVPPPEVLDRWLALVEERFCSSSYAPSSPPPATAGGDPSFPSPGDANGTIAVHCVAGLGRAPVLVAIALMEFENMDAIDAVTMIRRMRRGAINENQLQYLEGYRRRRRKKGGGGESGGCGCSIM
jgi:protein tyrosine phosphatase type 4A